jgi:hypothetical protein
MKGANMDECAKCGVQRDGQDVRLYYGNKKSELSKSYTSGKGTKTEITSVMTTTNYTVSGSENVRICDNCTKKRSRVGGCANAFWSVPLALFFVGGIVATFFSENLRQSFAGSPLSTIVGTIIIFLGIALAVTIKAVGSVSRLVKPLNETSRSAIARKVMLNRYAGKYDTFWTQAELDQLKPS